MELTNEFRVGVPVDDAYEILTDLERIAPCMPGAQLQSVEGDEYRGIVKIKVGPITAQYKGVATFVERVRPGRVVLRAEGRETKGQGNANAVITATLTADGDGTVVRVDTDLTVSGKVAQFGRGVLADVSAKLLDQFVERLESTVLGGDPPVVAGAGAADDRRSTVDEPGDGGDATASLTPAGRPASRLIDGPEVEPIDLLAAASDTVFKRVTPAALAAGLATLLWLLLRRRRP